MPELPEVETVRKYLKQSVLNKKIKEVTILLPKMIKTHSVIDFQKKLKGKTIKDIERKGKHLIFILSEDLALISHLRMEGSYRLSKKGEPLNKHEYAIFHFTDNTELRYSDTRKFGTMHLLKKDDLFISDPLKKIGLEPWDEELTPKYLKEKFKNKKITIKEALLDQTIITGIGNIYANEILFEAKINPKKKVNRLTLLELERIIIWTRKILQDAIEKGGTTIDTFKNVDGNIGEYQNDLKVHLRKDEECLNCGEKIKLIRLGGRSAYYCPNCQK